MDKLKLVRPSRAMRAQAEDYRREFFDHGEREINGSARPDQLDFDRWLERLEGDARRARPDWTVVDTYFAVREEDGAVVGTLEVRHRLETDYLAQYAGNIGYSVRPSLRRRGYATRMLELALDRARELGLDRVMVGCYTDNLPSRTVIQRCGGQLAEVKPYLNGKPMYVFWITL